ARCCRPFPCSLRPAGADAGCLQPPTSVGPDTQPPPVRAHLSPMEDRRRGPRRLLVHVGHTWMPLPVGEWIIGRAPESDIRIDDDKVSRRHALVRASDDGWELSDGGSLNGIWLDGRQVQRVTVPTGGVSVRFGGK